ncbi:protein SIEVE ELEMENT OCCLUSION B-like [Prosopis cineraria]|uniref:protein SIEVE ELEMENT OCCLUSION B-like n=1 Tax=Prosopis cineraria TaxID=364024 RepID=UPI00240F6277|nr:protein SIEVE ELEMENT OCCLUSION B-like [Prosopis cineraria]
MEASLKISDPNVKLNVNKEAKSSPFGFNSPTERLRKIACQMRSTVVDKEYSHAHETAERIITDLKEYPWHARAVMALAAFALDCGNFHLLSQVKDGDNLGASLAVLNDVQGSIISTNKETVSTYHCLVRNVFLTVQCLVKLMGMLQRHDHAKFEDMIPTLDKARHEFPDFVYWAIFATVVCSSTLYMGSSRWVSNGTLSETRDWISHVLETLHDYLKQIEDVKGIVDEYLERQVGAFVTPTGILQVLKCLLFPKDTKKHYVYYGSMKSRVKIDDEMFNNKCVFLFISELFGIEDEIKLLKKISEDLASDPKCEKHGMRKNDFRILWLPIVSSSSKSEKIKTQFNVVAQQFVTWSCVVDYSIVEPASQKLIKQELGYVKRPMVVVFNQRGRRTNNDALPMLSAWGCHAFKTKKSPVLK